MNVPPTLDLCLIIGLIILIFIALLATGALGWELYGPQELLIDIELQAVPWTNVYPSPTAV